MSPLQRALRTLVQLLVSGVLTGVVDVFAHGMTPQVAALVLAGWQVAVTFVHNAAEDAGWLPTVAKTNTPSEAGWTTVDICLIVIAVVAVLWGLGYIPNK